MNAKFCNERKRADCNEEIVHLKRKGIEQKSPDAVASETSALFGISYYRPTAILGGEGDQISVDSHKKWMSIEFNSANRNQS